MVLIHMSKDPQVDHPHRGLFQQRNPQADRVRQDSSARIGCGLIEAGLWNRRALARLFYVDLQHFKRLCPQRS
jgi:hypothetical protein